MTSAELTWFLCATRVRRVAFPGTPLYRILPCICTDFLCGGVERAIAWLGTKLTALPHRRCHGSRRPHTCCWAIHLSFRAQDHCGIATRANLSRCVPLADQNTPQGARFFQTDWDDFPTLSITTTIHTRSVSTRPIRNCTDRDLYNTWVAITRGKIKQPGTVIHERFWVGYVISDLEHDAFINAPRHDPQMEILYSDNSAIVFRVNTGR